MIRVASVTSNHLGHDFMTVGAFPDLSTRGQCVTGGVFLDSEPE